MGGFYVEKPVISIRFRFGLTSAKSKANFNPKILLCFTCSRIVLLYLHASYATLISRFLLESFFHHWLNAASVQLLQQHATQAQLHLN